MEATLDTISAALGVVLVAARQGRLDAVLAETGAFASRASVQRAIAKGLVNVGGKPASKPAQRVEAGQQLHILPWPEEPKPPAGPRIPLFGVLYEDEHVLVLNKPKGLVVHPGAGKPVRTLVDFLSDMYPSLAHVGEPTRPGIVHRLDKDTSGALAVAKTLEAHICLSKQFAARTVKKEYVALLWGEPSKPTGEMANTLSRSPKVGTRFTTRPGRGKGRPAFTTYSLLEGFDFVSLVSLRPHTGRTHQLRVQTAAIGHPIVGDKLYGPKTAALPKRLPNALKEAFQAIEGQLLHARQLAFRHPVTMAEIKVEAPLPFGFSLLLGLLSEDRGGIK